MGNALQGHCKGLLDARAVCTSETVYSCEGMTDRESTLLLYQINILFAYAVNI